MANAPQSLRGIFCEVAEIGRLLHSLLAESLTDAALEQVSRLLDQRGTLIARAAELARSERLDAEAASDLRLLIEQQETLEVRFSMVLDQLRRELSGQRQSHSHAREVERVLRPSGRARILDRKG